MRVNFRSRTFVVLVMALAASGLMIFAINTGPRSSSAASPQTPISRSALPQQSYADVVDRVAPAVVTIHAARRVRAPQMPDFFNDPMFRQFFGGGGRGTTPRSDAQRAPSASLKGMCDSRSDRRTCAAPSAAPPPYPSPG